MGLNQYNLVYNAIDVILDLVLCTLDSVDVAEIAPIVLADKQPPPLLVTLCNPELNH